MRASNRRTQSIMPRTKIRRSAPMSRALLSLPNGQKKLSSLELKSGRRHGGQRINSANRRGRLPTSGVLGGAAFRTRVHVRKVLRRDCASSAGSRVALWQARIAGRTGATSARPRSRPSSSECGTSSRHGERRKLCRRTLRARFAPIMSAVCCVPLNCSKPACSGNART